MGRVDLESLHLHPKALDWSALARGCALALPLVVARSRPDCAAAFLFSLSLVCTRGSSLLCLPPQSLAGMLRAALVARVLRAGAHWRGPARPKSQREVHAGTQKNMSESPPFNL